MTYHLAVYQNKAEGAGAPAFMFPFLARLPALATWVLVVLMALSLSYWTWRVVPLPASTSSGPIADTTKIPMARLRAQDWFAASGQGQPTTSSRYTLRWLYPGRPGVCILGVSGLQDKAFRVGDEIEPGTTLKEVGDDYVVLQTRAGVERLRLPEKPEVPRLIVDVDSHNPPVTSMQNPVSGRIRRDND